MKKSTYEKKAFDLYSSGEITGEVYDAMIMNADQFCDEDEDEQCGGFLPSWYAEIEYDDMSSYEAYCGCQFDDMNYLRYRER